VRSVYTSLKIYPGHSGSPLLNEVGDVVGVAFAAQQSSDYGYIIPLEIVRGFLNEELGNGYGYSY